MEKKQDRIAVSLRVFGDSVTVVPSSRSDSGWYLIYGASLYKKEEGKGKAYLAVKILTKNIGKVPIGKLPEGTLMAKGSFSLGVNAYTDKSGNEVVKPELVVFADEVAFESRGGESNSEDAPF